MKEAYHPALELILKLDKTDKAGFLFVTKDASGLEEHLLVFDGQGEATLENTTWEHITYFSNLRDVLGDKKEKPVYVPFELVTAEIVLDLITYIMSRLDYWRVMEGNDHATISKQ